MELLAKIITLESRIIGVGIIRGGRGGGGLDIVIINNKRGWNNRGGGGGRVEKIVKAVS